MGFSTILLLIFVILLGIYSYSILALNNNIVIVDLLFLNVEIEIGQIILFSTLIGMLIATILEIVFFSSRRKKDE